LRTKIDRCLLLSESGQTRPDDSGRSRVHRRRLLSYELSGSHGVCLFSCILATCSWPSATACAFADGFLRSCAARARCCAGVINIVPARNFLGVGFETTSLGATAARLAMLPPIAQQIERLMQLKHALFAAALAT
jgi:hypothetical protein